MKKYKDGSGQAVEVEKIMFNNLGEPESLLIVNRQNRREWVHARDYTEVKITDRLMHKPIKRKNTMLRKEQVINRPLDVEPDQTTDL